MTTKRQFELWLLAQLTEEYRSSVLAELGLSRSAALAAADEADIEYPAQNLRPLAWYIDCIGAPESVVATVDAPEVFSGSKTYRFALTLWPHLCWSIDEDRTGRVSDPRLVLRDRELRLLDPAQVQVGRWTDEALTRCAERAEVVDGWSEWRLIRFTFGADRYEGTFTWGLLQTWRRV